MFKKIKIGILNDHFDILGGGTVHSFKFLEYLRKYYDCDVYLPKIHKTEAWMKNFLHLDTKGLKFYKYTKGIGKKYNYMFLNISHWKCEETNALKKYMLVFFPQFYFPIQKGYEFLANSEYTKEHIIKRWKQSSKNIHVVYPPIMTSQFKSLKKTNSIIHVSRIASPRPEADKGHAQMIEAFKNLCDKGLKNWQFNIVGQIQDRIYYDNLMQLTKGYPITIFSSVSFNKLKTLYGQAKIYWHMTGVTMPNEVGAQEHFGMTIVEAMASGCIPLSLNTGGPKEIITNGLEGFLVKNTKQLEKKTLRLIKDKAMFKDMLKMVIKRSECFNEKISKKQFYSVISKTNKVSIIILCWNNAKYTRDCINQLYKVTPPGFELIVIDNASTDNTKDILLNLKKKYKDIRLIFNKKNLGFARGNNIGLRVASNSYICYLNNDTLPQYGWLERMIDVLETNNKAGIIGARLYFPEHLQRGWVIQHAGITLKSGEPKHIGGRRKEAYVRKGGIEEVEATTGACMLIRKSLARFDERFKRGYYEDISLCLKIRARGYKVYINHEAKLIHYEGVSQVISKNIDKEKFKKITLKNKALFHSLWDKKIKKLPKVNLTLDLKGTNKVKNIEIGGGETPLYPNYSQVDLRKLPKVKFVNDARLLPFASNSISNICSSYMLQCLTLEEAGRALREWFRVLKPGGKLEIHVPDLDKIMRMFISTQDEELLKEIYGHQVHELDYYHYGWTFQTLDILLSKINFVRVTLLKPLKDNALSLKAFKPL